MSLATRTPPQPAATEVPCERDDRYDEMWDGVPYAPPIAGSSHQDFATQFAGVMIQAIGRGNATVFAGCNVSDRLDGWAKNYRIPDVAVYLAGNPAVIHEAFAQGGPDFAVEITSQGEDPHAKLDFYAAVNTRELVVVRRDLGWRLELFRLGGGTLGLAGDIGPGAGGLTLESVGVTLRVEAAEPRPDVVVAHPATGREWRA